MQACGGQLAAPCNTRSTNLLHPSHPTTHPPAPTPNTHAPPTPAPTPTPRLRSWQLTLGQALSAVLLVLLIWAVDEAMMYSARQGGGGSGASTFSGNAGVRSPKPRAIGGVPLCSDSLLLKVRVHVGVQRAPISSSIVARRPQCRKPNAASPMPQAPMPKCVFVKPNRT